MGESRKESSSAAMGEHGHGIVSLHLRAYGTDPRTWQDGIVVKERWKYTNILVRRFILL